VADGRRGRRWRAITCAEDGLLISDLLLEVDPAGRVRKLELASLAGLLTLHPDREHTALHGNVVRPAGVEHVTLPWSGDSLLMAGGSPVTGVVAARELASRVGVGEGATFPAVEVAEDLSIRRATWRVARVGERRWLLLAADRGPAVTVAFEEDGTPTGLDAAEAWPLEAVDPA